MEKEEQRIKFLSALFRFEKQEGLSEVELWAMIAAEYYSLQERASKKDQDLVVAPSGLGDLLARNDQYEYEKGPTCK